MEPTDSRGWDFLIPSKSCRLLWETDSSASNSERLAFGVEVLEDAEMLDTEPPERGFPPSNEVL